MTFAASDFTTPRLPRRGDRFRDRICLTTVEVVAVIGDDVIVVGPDASVGWTAIKWDPSRYVEISASHEDGAEIEERGE